MVSCPGTTFLAVLTLGVTRLKLTRTQAVIGAWLVSAVLFGLIHLPTGLTELCRKSRDGVE